ncbi:MAG: c-type cytochrome [Elusimicrobia bacterium]|nr:c-type cytochrome [Elusimicrobiota bacterium]
MYRKLFYTLNALMLAAFIVAAIVDYRKEWREYQGRYYRLMAADLEGKARQSADPEQTKRLRDQARQLRGTPLQIRQIIAKDLGRVDRCITCHVGMDEFLNPSLTTDLKEHPFTGHPDVSGIIRSHPLQKFGCTVCHAGQGLATELEAAHGYAENWEKPLGLGPLLQSSCVKCHGNLDTLRGAEVVAKGKKLFDDHGCIGCHQIRGVGGVISVDLGNIADKPLERIAPYNFSLIKTADGKPLPRRDWKLPAWIEAHMTNDTIEFVPNDPFAKYNKEPIAPSGMPDFRGEITPEGAKAITAFLLSQTEEEKIPIRYYVPGPPKTEPKFAGAAAHGKYVFDKHGCSGCHGLGGAQGRRNYNAMGPGQADPRTDMDKGREPALTDTVGTFTRDELRAKIQAGVPSSQIAKFNPDGPTPPLYMPAWKDKIKGVELEDLITYLLSIAKQQEDF